MQKERMKKTVVYHVILLHLFFALSSACCLGFLDTGPFSARATDIWSTGIVLSFLIFDQSPFSASSVTRMHEAIVSERYPK